jgi:hypothetical protein
MASFSMTFEQWSGSAANIATVAAVITAGWWTYTRFLKHRSGAPSASLSLEAWERRLTSDRRLIRVGLNVENTGAVILPVQELRCEIYRVFPLSAETEGLIADDALIDTDGEASLPCLDQRKKHWAEEEFEIEPGESDMVPFDFVIEEGIESVLIYAHIPNSTKSKAIGWDVSEIRDIDQQSASVLPRQASQR